MMTQISCLPGSGSGDYEFVISQLRQCPRAVSENEDPAAASRPFDADRDGFVMSEGAGILVLESLDSAIGRNAPILCEVLGYGASSDAYHMVASHPEGTGAYLAMKNALKRQTFQRKTLMS